MSGTSTILLIDDDVDLCESIKNLLAQHGFKTLITHNSHQIEGLLKNNPIDLILLDIILPGGKDGIAICKLIRHLTNAPIIMLSGVETDVEKIISLEVGADNYITKPFNSRVLLAHIHSALRRQDSLKKAKTNASEPHSALVDIEYEMYEFLGWRLNVTARVLLSPKNKIIKITSAEFFLLHAFVRHPQCVLSRDQLLSFVNASSQAFDRSIDILVSRLRSKIESHHKGHQIINTIRNSGYLLSCCVNKVVMNSKAWQELISSI